MQEQMIKAYVNQVFDKYDTDKSGTLDEEELTYFFNDLFKILNINTTVTRQQSLEAIRSIDQNSDGNVDREELFLAFQKMLGSAPKQQMTQSYPNSNYPTGDGFSPRTNSNISSSYPPPPMNPPSQYPQPGYNSYYPPPEYNYGIENPYMKQPQYYPPPPQQYQQPYPGYQQPYQPPYQQSPYQPQYQAPYQQTPPPYSNYQTPYMSNSNPYMSGSPGGRWGQKQ